jgi:E3 ubiquitin-protein ligase UBR4
MFRNEHVSGIIAIQLYLALTTTFFFFNSQKVGCSGEEQWPSALADFIRHNDEVLLRASDQLLAFYTEELLPCASFDEYCDVLGLLGEVDDPATFLADVLRSVGTG